MKGWISIHRKIKGKGWWKDSHYVHLWVHILLSANHEESEFMWNGEIMKVKRGQFITGRKALSKETGIQESKIERILKLFVKEQQIEQQTTTKYRLITIRNYNTYQPLNNKRTTNEQQMNTNNNNNNNNKKERSLSYLVNIPEEDLIAFKEKGYDKSWVVSKGEDLYLYCESKGKTYKNYKALLTNALKKDYGKDAKKNLNYKQPPKEPERKLTPEEQARIEEKKKEIAGLFKVKAQFYGNKNTSRKRGCSKSEVF